MLKKVIIDFIIRKQQYKIYLVCGEKRLDIIKDGSFQYEQKTPMTTLEGYREAKQIVFLDNGRLFNERIKVFFNEIDNIEVEQ